ncbi:MAG: acyl carrier protein [Deltaproteobacteria bacterium RIFOXYA12_FULL_61_11]|nr:MAG: acyl carrier protein [Deltaproteobacteria bacterium RIFOXYA12_FULL_61_11]
MSIEKRITSIIVEQLSVDEEMVTREVTLEELGADSLDMVELIMAIEEEFGIDVPEDEQEAIKTVNDVIRYLEDKLRAQKGENEDERA